MTSNNRQTKQKEKRKEKHTWFDSLWCIDCVLAGNQSGQLISLHGQITTLKLENETLRGQIKVLCNSTISVVSAAGVLVQ